MDFDSGEHVYRVHPNVQLVTDPVIMTAKEEHECDSGTESLTKLQPCDILHCHVERRDQGLNLRSTALEVNTVTRNCYISYRLEVNTVTVSELGDMSIGRPLFQ
jgi:hypothetical protein